MAPVYWVSLGLFILLPLFCGLTAIFMMTAMGQGGASRRRH